MKKKTTKATKKKGTAKLVKKYGKVGIKHKKLKADLEKLQTRMAKFDKTLQELDLH